MNVDRDNDRTDSSEDWREAFQLQAQKTLKLHNSVGCLGPVIVFGLFVSLLFMTRESTSSFLLYGPFVAAGVGIFLLVWLCPPPGRSVRRAPIPFGRWVPSARIAACSYLTMRRRNGPLAPPAAMECSLNPRPRATTGKMTRIAWSPSVIAPIAARAWDSDERINRYQIMFRMGGPPTNGCMGDLGGVGPEFKHYSSAPVIMVDLRLH